MDQISLTDLRRQFFGPTLDESVLYGVDCLMDLFGVNPDRMSLKRSVSDLNQFKSCRDVSLHGEASAPVRSLVDVKEKNELDELNRDTSLEINNTKTEKNNTTPQEDVSSTSSTSTQEKISKQSSLQERISGKKRSINSTVSPKTSFKSSWSNKLFSPSEPSNRTKSSFAGISKMRTRTKLANSYIFETTASSSAPPRERHSPRTSRHTGIPRSLPTLPPKTPSRRPKLIRTRWAIAKVNEFDDGAKTFEILQTDQHSADNVRQLKNQVIGAGVDLPPETVTEIVFAYLPDGSTLSYRGGSEKRCSA